MDNIKNITVIGDGGWGTAIAILLNNKGSKVRIWSAFDEYASILDSTRENKKFLPGIIIPKQIIINSNADDAIDAADLIVVAVPSQYLRAVLSKFDKVKWTNKIIVSLTKGIENNTLKRPSEIIEEILGISNTVVLSGPTIVYEVVRGFPTAVVAASTDQDAAKLVQSVFMTETFRVYSETDLIGVELGGALKNIIAISAGICDGLGFGVNTKAGLLTRGLVEIARLGVKMGGRRETFTGLSGLGDLVTTCISSHGRNRWLGEEIGRGKKPMDALASTEMVVEGVATSKSARELAIKYNVEMPICQQIYYVLYENKDPKIALKDLMTRSAKLETEEIY